MTDLAALHSLLDAKREAGANLRQTIGGQESAAVFEAQSLCLDADDALHAVLTDDTIEALLAVAEADDPEPPKFDRYSWNKFGCVTPLWRAWNKRRAALAAMRRIPSPTKGADSE